MPGHDEKAESAPRPQLGKIMFGDAKRLLQHYPGQSGHLANPQTCLLMDP
jgi:hypothetical protein